jgi:putative photosynthetic complex assembly protein
MTHTHNEKFPKGALIGAAGLIAISLLAAAVSRIDGVRSMVPASSPVAALDLRFADRSDGGVDVIDANGLRPITIVSPGSNAFLRATLRGLAQQRKREFISGDIPFRLTEWVDGRLTLDDPATSRHIELEAFGPTNAAAFAKLLHPEIASPPDRQAMAAGTKETP